MTPSNFPHFPSLCRCLDGSSSFIFTIPSPSPFHFLLIVFLTTSLIFSTMIHPFVLSILKSLLPLSYHVCPLLSYLFLVRFSFVFPQSSNFSDSGSPGKWAHNVTSFHTLPKQHLPRQPCMKLSVLVLNCVCVCVCLFCCLGCLMTCHSSCKEHLDATRSECTRSVSHKLYEWMQIFFSLLCCFSSSPLPVYVHVCVVIVLVVVVVVVVVVVPQLKV